MITVTSTAKQFRFSKFLTENTTVGVYILSIINVYKLTSRQGSSIASIFTIRKYSSHNIILDIL